MIESIITIKDCDMESYLYGLDDIDEPIFTKNFDDIASFESLEDAEEFANKCLNEEYSYEIVSLKRTIKLDETILKTINY